MSGDSPEQKFLAYLGSRLDIEQSLVSRLPSEIFSSEGREVISKRTYDSIKVQTSEEEATRFLKTQLLALLGKEIGKSQRNGLGTSRIKQITNLLSECEQTLSPLSISDFSERYPVVREYLPTGINDLDAEISGIAPGDLGVWVAPSGRGKSLVLLNIAVYALFSGKNVLYITVGDQGFDELAPRIDTCILEEPLPKNTNESILSDRHRKATSLIRGRLWIADFTDDVCLISDVERAISEKKADLVIVDHADDIINTYSTDLAITRHSLRITYTTLKKLAAKYHVGIWTASQSHEYLWHSKEGSTADMAESKVGKSSPSALILVITANLQDPESVNVTIAKARRSYRNRIIQMRVDHQLMRVW